MTARRQPLVVAAAAILSIGTLAARQPNPAIEKAFEAFWKADDPGDAAKAGERLVKAGVDFETTWSRLKAGRPYKKEKTGEFTYRYPAPLGAVFDNGIEVPADYDPARTWQVRVQLHGGVNRAAESSGAGPGLDGGDETSAGGAGSSGRAPNLERRRAPNRIPGESQIYVYPSGWVDAAWWHQHQLDNILRIVDRLKRSYNVDESRVYLTGISDGGSGVYYIGMREPTLWSALLPLNGSIKVLGNPIIRADGEMYPPNLVNKPLYIVSGGRDPLYPADHIQTHVDAFKLLGVSVVFKPQPSAGHDTSWWRWERDSFEQFVRTHAREPHPAKLSWETERVDRFNRVHWLVIDRLGSGSQDSSFRDVEIFTHKKPSGRVDVVREGNSIDARSRGVREFTLLLSPDVFDFAKPMVVTVNGKPAYDGRMQRDVATLVKWAARDNDRTMLYGAALTIRVP